MWFLNTQIQNLEKFHRASQFKDHSHYSVKNQQRIILNRFDLCHSPDNNPLLLGETIVRLTLACPNRGY